MPTNIILEACTWSQHHQPRRVMFHLKHPTNAESPNTQHCVSWAEPLHKLVQLLLSYYLECIGFSTLFFAFYIIYIQSLIGQYPWIAGKELVIFRYSWRILIFLYFIIALGYDFPNASIYGIQFHCAGSLVIILRT